MANGLRRANKSMERSQGQSAGERVELTIPALWHALAEKSTLRVEDAMNVSGLQLHHYVRTGNKTMMPQRYRSHKLVKWLKATGC